MKRFCYILFFALHIPAKSFMQDCTPDNSESVRTTPHKYVCYLRKFNARGSAYTSTAFLIAPRILLTSAHNVYKADRFEIAPGHNGQGIELEPGNPSLTYGMIRIKKTDQNTLYDPNFIYNENKRTRKQKRHLDFAVIILPDNTLFEKLGGYLEITECDKVAKAGDDLSFIGYPGGIEEYNHELFQKTNSGTLTGYYENGNMISYNFGTHRGASGSPVIIKSNGGFKAVGIHGYGSDCDNSGVKITKELIDKIKQWTMFL